MAFENRDYNRYDGNNIAGGFGKLSVVHWLLGINVLVWLLDRIFTGSERASIVSPFRWMNFNVSEGLYGWQIWRLVTYQFVHSLSDFIHIFFNMMILLTLGPAMEQWWGSKRFTVFYLLCGVSGAVFFVLLWYTGILGYQASMPLIGASGAIYGICVGAAAVFPHQKLKMLWLPFEFKLRTFAIVIMVIAFASVSAGSANAGGEAAHLGGALLGFLLVKNASWLNFADRMNPQAIQAGWTKGRYEKRVKQDQNQAAEVDRILAKVKEHGLQSLSAKEKKTLNRDTDEKRKAG